MSKFSILFQANTTGVHHIGYRTYNDPINTYNVIDITVVTPGLQEVIIDVPGNLYCAHAGIRYTGYLIAGCEDQTDANGDGIPDLATTWIVDLVQQTDPCQKTQIECIGVPILDCIIVDNGTGLCAPDGPYPLIITEANPGDEIIPADIILTVTGGIIVSYLIINPGLYKSLPLTSTVIGGCSTVPEIDLIMGTECAPLMLSSYGCRAFLDLSANSRYTIVLNDTVEFCADVVALAGLPVSFEATATGNCHCDGCRTAVITVPGGTLGEGKISYQTCWDGSGVYNPVVMVSRIVNFGDTINLGCILPDTIVVDNGTLDAPINVALSNCL